MGHLTGTEDGLDWLMQPGTLSQGLFVVSALIGAYLTFRKGTEAQRDAAVAEEEASRAVGEYERSLDAALSKPLTEKSADESSGDGRVERLVRSLRESDAMLAELRAELETRKAAVDALRAEEAQSRHLAALRAEEAAAIKALIDRTISAAHEQLQGRLVEEQSQLRERLGDLQQQLDVARTKGRREQGLFFVSGALLSVPIGFLVNHFS